MRSRRAIGGLIGLVFAIVYLFLAFGAAGAGHGTRIFFAAIFPYGLGLLAFPVLGFIIGDLRPFAWKVVFVCLLAIHYAFVINFLRLEWLTELPYVEKSWNYSQWSIILPAVSYFGAQLLLWLLFIRSFVVDRRDGA